MGLNKKLFIQADTGLVNTENFGIQTWTGNQTARSINFGVDTDFYIAKNRSGGYGHFWIWQDVVRGDTKLLYSNSTNAEGNWVGDYVDFTSTGIDITHSGTNTNAINETNFTYVGYAFKAGGAAVSNTDGAITSQVSANQDAGFSIVSYTGNNGSSATIGHGLSSAPELVIIKARNLAAGWPTLAAPSGTIAFTGRLNETGATSSSLGSVFFNSTAPTSTVFSVGGSDEVNDGYNYIAYCFHSVDGYQKVGTYTGNGSSTGPVVTTGFQPRFIMVKRTDSTGDWMIYDSVRDTTNPVTNRLFANLNNEEVTVNLGIDFDANGFQPKDTHIYLNANGGTYLYLAIA